MLAKVEDIYSKRRFPVARKFLWSEFVVVFIDETTGMVVAASESSGMEVGYKRTDWTPCDEKNAWAPVALTIVG